MRVETLEQAIKGHWTQTFSRGETSISSDRELEDRDTDMKQATPGARCQRMSDQRGRRPAKRQLSRIFLECCQTIAAHGVHTCTPVCPSHGLCGRARKAASSMAACCSTTLAPRQAAGMVTNHLASATLLNLTPESYAVGGEFQLISGTLVRPGPVRSVSSAVSFSRDLFWYHVL